MALLVLALKLGLSTGSNATASPGEQTPQPIPQPTSLPSRPVLLTDPVPDPHQAGVQWFAPPGHTLRGAFLDYWRRYGGLAQFGYPLTEEFVEPVGPDNKPLQVQYFERNRFEHHPENAGTPYEVLLGTLGLDFRPVESVASPLPIPARYFNETGHNLSGPFLTYWEAHGGMFTFGFPITEQVEEANQIDHNRYTVQYFERARFEYHPENAGSQYEVLLGLLGRQLSEKKGYPYGWYPQYGYAPDFSWMSGEIFYLETPVCSPEECGCILFKYGRDPDKRVQMNIDKNGLRHTILSIFSKRGSHTGDTNVPFVVFGYFARPGERFRVCGLDPQAPGYVVEQAQANPAP
jgi:hypothetical protein